MDLEKYNTRISKISYNFIDWIDINKYIKMNSWISWNGSKKSECKKIFNGIDLKQFDAIADVFGGSGWLSLYAVK